MKNIFITVLFCFGFVGCGISSLMKFSSSETLMKLNYKLPQYGYFTFVVYINENEVKEVIYHYSIDMKNSRCICFMSSENIYNRIEYCKQKDCYGLESSTFFENSLRNSLLERYFTCFASNFLQMTNDEKLKLLNELSKKK